MGTGAAVGQRAVRVGTSSLSLSWAYPVSYVSFASGASVPITFGIVTPGPGDAPP